MTPTIEQLTAYALGEGTAGERAAIEAHLATDPAARAEVAAIRETAQLLSHGLAAEKAPGLDAKRRRALSQLDAPRRIRFPAWIGIVASGALAAGIAVAVMPTAMEPAGGEPSSRGAVEPLLAKQEASAERQAPAAPTMAPAPVTAMAPAKAKELSAPAAPPAPAALAGNAPFATGNAQAFAIQVPAERMNADADAGARAPASASAEPAAPVVAQRLAKTRDRKDGARVEEAAKVADAVAGSDAERDASSFAEIRRFLDAGSLPPPEAVRTSELVNAFRYAYAPARDPAVHPQVIACPWDADHRLVRIGSVDGTVAATSQPSTDRMLRIAFDPSAVAAWRLIDDGGRMVPIAEARTDLRTVGAGPMATALYEIEPLRSATKPAAPGKADARRGGGDLLTVSLLWKRPDGTIGATAPMAVADAGGPGDADTRFAAAVAEFAQCLRGQPGPWDLERVLRTAQASAGTDAQRLEFVELVHRARQLRR